MENEKDTSKQSTSRSESDSKEATWEKVKFWLADTGKQLAIAILIVLVLRSSIIEPYKIPSGSMIPTLFIGDHIFVNKFAYGFKVPFSDVFLEEPIYVGEQQLPKRGDVIVFIYPKNESFNYIKRVIGLPGDTIAIRDKELIINDRPVPEKSYDNPAMLEGIENEADRNTLNLYMSDMDGVQHPVLHDGRSIWGSDWGPITVPAGTLFVMGDNRDRSSDSRMWGIVPLKKVKGKAMFIWLNFVLGLGEGQKFSFRPSRIFTWIR